MTKREISLVTSLLVALAKGSACSDEEKAFIGDCFLYKPKAFALAQKLLPKVQKRYAEARELGWKKFIEDNRPS